ncbi:ferritin-like domain-containing protein [Rhizobium straminoryzae]|uniref:Ferritin-like domain-containing protein n=1 Tax=Rhizobium straminoryzae TaxID=1387186 RepID=A0A549TA84_9HYPH|nr:demethoxyubiquinone hydroxylase family protein [Rhizobium straminoryzae]TRL38786.1 ferritin-like domain-containing protein [Rhizobium straminoryzae]
MTHAIVHFRDWLRDAHAMEVQAIALLSAQIARIENYPELRERLELHLAQTEGHASALQSLLERAQDSPSMLRDVAGRVTAAAQGMSGIMASDEVVKATIAAYGFEHAEIARYLVLIAAADELGDTEAVDVFRRILAEEQAMADWLALHLDVVTRLYLVRDERDLLSKR